MSMQSTAPDTKLTRWRERLHTFPNASQVQIGRGYDLSTHPAHPRASFPYPSLPPYKVLAKEDILGYLVSIPNIQEIGYLGYILGLVSGILMTASKASRVRRLSLLGLTIVVLRWYLQRQKPVVREDISRQSNVSGSPDGPCMVTETIVSVTNSHAGTHADTPYHFLPAGGDVEQGEGKKEYNLEVYSGDAIVLDITRFLDDAGGANEKRISAELLTRVTRELGVEWSSVWRVLFCTRTTLTEEDLKNTDLQRERQQWPKTFAHFTKDGALFLVNNAPNLLLVGVDTPSIDHSSVSPICQFSHGTFCGAEIAILENLDFDYLPQLFPPFPPLASSSASAASPTSQQGAQSGTNNVDGGCTNTSNVGDAPPESGSRLFTSQNDQNLDSAPGSVNRATGSVGPQSTSSAAHSSLRAGSRGRTQLFGTMQTVFHPTQCFEDAKGCSVIFYPE